MANIENLPEQYDTVGDLKIRTENIAFDREKLIACGKCGRTNPPTRLQCLYCADDLSVDQQDLDLTKLKLRIPDDWEPGFNVILIKAIDPDGLELPTIAKVTQMPIENIRTVVGLKRPLPLVRVGSEREAELVRDRLDVNGVMCSIVSDDSLLPDRLPARLRGVGFGDSSVRLVDFNTGNVTEIVYDDLALVVRGIVQQTTIDNLEKKRRGKDPKLIDSTEASSDSPILDVYSRGDPIGFRILTSGFDFSCLGGDKSLLAADNLTRLAARLKQFAPNTKFVDDYSAVRHALSDVWEVERRKDSRGMQRSGFAKFEFGNTVSSSNLRQMNRFSRLQWHLL